jgi:hypothetical protein
MICSEVSTAIVQSTDDEIAAPTVLRIAEQNEGAAILDDLRTFICPFVAFPEPEQSDAIALWVVHSHAFDAAETTPRLSSQSAEKRSGKTRLLELLDLLVRSPVSTASISAAALFRLVAEGPATLLIDEIDTVFTSRGSGAQDLRGLSNAGYRRGGRVIRSAGKGRGTERYSVFAPVVLAGIGNLPDTVADRSIPIRMKRRADGEPVEKFRRRDVEQEAHELRARIGRWADEQVDTLATVRPDMPDVLGDRAADIWESLLAIASPAGDDWSERAETAAIALSARATTDDRSPGVRLLEAIRTVLEQTDRSQIASAELAVGVNDTDVSRGGEPIDARELAARLREFDIRPRPLRRGNEVFRGNCRSDFEDAFARYLPTTVVTVSQL